MCFVVVRRVALGRGHAKAQELTNRHRARAKPLPDAGDQREASDPAQKSLDATPVHALPLVGMAFSDDPVTREEFAKLVNELRHISKALAETRAPGGIISRSGHLINFKTTLENLGIAVPEGMTDAQAADEFLRHMEKMSGTLVQLRSALERGPWDWGKASGWFPSKEGEGRERLAGMLRAAANVTFGLAQAQWRSGESLGASSHWEMLRLLALRASDDTTYFGARTQSTVQSLYARAVGAGISLDGWTDDQLGLIPQSLATYDAVRTMHGGLEAEWRRIEEFIQRPAEVRAWFEPGQARPDGFGSTLRRCSFDLASDQQIKDNLAVIAADYGYAMARFDLEKRVYIPPVPGQREPSLEIVTDRSFFTDFYFLPFKELVNWNEKQASFGPSASSALWGQAITDHARLAAALEIQRRAKGQYPESIEAVSGAFPGGMPHDVATGQPYFYERIQDGSYKLWGTGIDQTNNNGDPKKDILFTLPKVE